MSIPSEFSDITEEELAGLRARARLRWENERANSRFSLPIVYRLPLATTCSFLTGMGLGMSRGSRKAALQFRAENAHRLPTTPKGWYLYHKSKNYQVGWGGIKEGLKMGSKLSFWVIGYFGIEHALDEFWGKKDFTSSVAASLVVSGGFSWRSKCLPAIYDLLERLLGGVD